MGIKNSLHVVDRYVNSSFDTVKLVHDNLATLENFESNLPSYAHIAGLKTADIPPGRVVRVLGYHSDDDGVNGLYVIENGGTYDNLVNHQLNNGNVARLLHNGTIDIRQAGAKLDNYWDDTPSLQAAINALPLLPGSTTQRRGSIYIPIGTCRLTGQVTSYSGVSLVGANSAYGYSSLVHEERAASVIVLEYTSGVAGIKVLGNGQRGSSGSILNLAFAQPDFIYNGVSTYAGLGAVDLDNVVDYHVSHCSFERIAGDYALRGSGTGITVSQCSVNQVGDGAFTAPGSGYTTGTGFDLDQAEDSIVALSRVSQCGSYALSVGEGTKLDSVVVDACGDALRVNGARVEVSSPTFQRNMRHGVLVASGQDCLIMGGQIRGNNYRSVTAPGSAGCGVKVDSATARVSVIGTNFVDDYEADPDYPDKTCRQLDIHVGPTGAKGLIQACVLSNVDAQFSGLTSSIYDPNGIIGPGGFAVSGCIDEDGAETYSSGFYDNILQQLSDRGVDITNLGLDLDDVGALAQGARTDIDNGIWQDDIDLAIADYDLSMVAQFDSIQAILGNSGTTIDQLNIAISDEAGARGAQYSSLVSSIGSNSSAINTLASTNVNDEGSIAHYVDTLSLSYGEGTATLQQIATATADVSGNYTAQWNVKTDVNDLKGGVGFYNDGVTTKFVIDAGYFEILNSDNNTTEPFLQVVTEIAGTPEKPAGLYLNGAINVESANIIGLLTADEIVANSTIETPIIQAGTVYGADFIAAVDPENTDAADILAGTDGVHIAGSTGILTATGATLRELTVLNAAGEAVMQSGVVQTDKLSEIPISASNKITSGNIGTYLSSAAIGTAYIADANVTTLKIEGNAVTVPVSAWTGDEIDASTDTVVQSITMDTEGYPVTLWWGFATRCSASWGKTVAVALVRNGTTIWSTGSLSILGSSGGEFQYHSGAYTHTPPAGTYTYELRVTRSATDTVRHRSLIGVATKR